MDNAPIHISEGCANVEKITHNIAVGVKLEFFPSYSPYYNPIEEAFAEFKAWLKAQLYLLVSEYETYDEFLEAGLQVIGSKPGKHFRSCHIEM